MTGVPERVRAARDAAREVLAAGAEARSAALARVSAALESEAPRILAANAEDLAAARGLSEPLVARLSLSSGRLRALSRSLAELAAAPDPVGRVRSRTELADGLVLEHRTEPLGLLAVIFESRPDAVPQIAGLALRSGNGVVLKGGAEARRSTEALRDVIATAIAPLPAAAVTLLHDRAEVAELLALDDAVDLVIPRGSNALVQQIRASTRIPVLGHADGVCHVYVDAAADLDRAVAIAVDSKTDHPAACNAMETLLVHASWVGPGLERLLGSLRAAGVRLHAGSDGPWTLPPAPALHHEYGELACTVALVADVDAAIAWIERHGSGHTDAIVTEDAAAAGRFVDAVDSACVFVNASTRFADGARFGLGAEVGISTSKLHARGPVGVEGLLTTKWVLRGHGDTVAPFSAGARAFRWARSPGDPTDPR